MRTILALLLFLLATPAVAQLSDVGGGPIELGRLDHNEAEIDAAHRTSMARARALGPVPAAALTRTPRLQFPLRLRSQSEAFQGILSPTMSTGRNGKAAGLHLREAYL